MTAYVVIVNTTLSYYDSKMPLQGTKRQIILKSMSQSCQFDIIYTRLVWYLHLTNADK